jgi:hypothetical protein
VKEAKHKATGEVYAVKIVQREGFEYEDGKKNIQTNLER